MQRQGADAVLDRAAQAEIGILEVELAGLDFGEVEDVVDELQERIGRALDDIEVFALMWLEGGIEC